MRRLLLATAAAVGLSGAASAQHVTGLYIAGGAMLNYLQDSDISLGGGLTNSPVLAGMGRSGTVEYNLGYGGALAIGYGFGNGLRAELEGSYRYNEVDGMSGFGAGSFNLIRGSQRTYGAMVNLLYEFDLSPRFRPYLGAGVGWMWTEWHAVRGTNSVARIGSDDTASDFAYQLIAGFAVPLSQRWALTLDYRFMQVVDPELDGLAARVVPPNGVARGKIETESFNHAVMLGVRYNFGVAPPPVAAPAVAPQPARTFLVFFDWNRADLNQRARQIVVNHPAHVGFVDAHAERDRCHHHARVVANESFLIATALLGIETGVIGQGIDAVRLQLQRQLVDAFARQAVHDACAVFARSREQLVVGALVLRANSVIQIRAIEARDVDCRIVQGQLIDDVLTNARRRRGGECKQRHVFETPTERGELPIFRTEIVAPFGHAVRLVDHERGDAAASRQTRQHAIQKARL